MGIKRNLVFDKMLTAFYSFQSFNVTDKSQFVQPYIPLIKLQTYTNKLKTYTWNVLPHPRNCPFVQFTDAQAAILLASDR